MRVVLDTNALVSGIFFKGPPMRILEAEALLDFVMRESHIVDPVPVPASACDDPDDLMFLACAIAGRAKPVVTGDRALLRASGFRGVEVVTPRKFLRRCVDLES